MNQPLTLNCDMGEGFGPWKMGNDEGIMSLIDAANIACGGHAGDPSTMRQCVTLARKHDTEIGAHVSYPDKEGFGRRAMDIRVQYRPVRQLDSESNPRVLARGCPLPCARSPLCRGMRHVRQFRYRACALA